VAPLRDEIFKQKRVNDCVQHIYRRSSPISTQFGHGVFRIFAMRYAGPVFCTTLYNAYSSQAAILIRHLQAKQLIHFSQT